MTTRMLNNRIKKLEDLERRRKVLDDQISKLKSEVQDEMAAQDVEMIDTGMFLIRWTRFMSDKFDTRRFKENQPELFAAYTTKQQGRRFSYSATKIS